MPDLKTTKEERARLREEAPCIVVEFGTNNDGYTGTSPRNEEVTGILDDLDTLEAEVKRLRRIETASGAVEEAARALLRFSRVVSRDGSEAADELVSALDALEDAKL
jgi:hypothetical protein